MSLVEREKRVGLHLPVEVRGEEAGGVRFTEYTRSVNISGGGICFESHRHVASFFPRARTDQPNAIEKK